MRQGEQRQNKEKRREGRKKDEQGARGDGRAENRFFATLRMTGRMAQTDGAKKTKRAMCVENKKSSLDVGAVKRRTD